MPKTNAEIAAFRDPNKTRAGWWEQEYIYENGSVGFVHGWKHKADVPPFKYGYTGNGRYTGPDFAKDDIACFTELRPVLLAMGCSVIHGQSGVVVHAPDKSVVGCCLDSCHGTYAAALTPAFSWAMDNQPEALRRACEEVGRV